MSTPRRFLPSISLLSAFEIAAQTGSFSEAARELSFTQGAVSRQIKALEEQLGVQLFVRIKKRVYLTEAGAAYAKEIREALKIIARASLALKANPQGGTLNLAILPTFGTRWLAPRLNDFLSQHPGITVNLSTKLVPFDFERESLDAAIHFGRPDWPNTGYLKLMNEQTIPVGSPDLIANHAIKSPEDFQQAPLLHLETRPDAWEKWLEEYNIDAGSLPGMLFDQFATMAQAAVHGIGFALLPKFLINNELSEGKLAPVFEKTSSGYGSYYLVWPQDKDNYPPLIRFRDWIEDVTAENN